MSAFRSLQSLLFLAYEAAGVLFSCSELLSFKDIGGLRDFCPVAKIKLIHFDLSQQGDHRVDNKKDGCLIFI